MNLFVIKYYFNFKKKIHDFVFKHRYLSPLAVTLISCFSYGEKLSSSSLLLKRKGAFVKQLNIFTFRGNCRPTKFILTYGKPLFPYMPG